MTTLSLPPETALRSGELTVVIPTYNRHDHLSRLVSYYSGQTMPVTFLVLDSSLPDVVEANRATIAGCDARFRHHVFPSTTPVAAKLAEGLTHVSTPYCAFCADDDLVFGIGLESALQFLRDHPEHVCADGIYLNYRLRPGNAIQLQIEYASGGIELSHPVARVFRLYQRYESLFYGVFRTRDLATIFSSVRAVPSLHYQELFQATAALLLGRSHRLPVFYAARQHGDPADPTRDKWQTFYWYVDDRGEFYEHYLAYREALWRFYVEETPAPHLGHEDFTRAMDFSHTMFFGLNVPPAYLHSALKELWPADAFQNLQAQPNDIFDVLKPERRRRWEGRITAWMGRLREKMEAYDRHTVVKSLDVEIRQSSRTPWKCWILMPELQWLAGVPEFRGAYRELCKYMEHPRPLEP